MSIPHLSSLLLGAALALALAGAPVRAQDADPVLIENAVAQIRKSDYERELMRLPAEVREGFNNNARRVQELLRRMLANRVLALQAKEAKLDQDPETAARIASEIERYLARLQVHAVEMKAAADFEANLKVWEARAREVFLANRSKYDMPEQMRASHILFDLKRHSSAEAEKLAREWRAKIAAGMDFNDVAKRVSEDPTAPKNAGRIDWFVAADMDPAFSAAAFALKKTGEVSEPVLTRFGWHLIRMEERKASGPRSFEQVRDEILDELRREHMAKASDAYSAAVRNDPSTRLNNAAVDAIVPKAPDQETVRKLIEQKRSEAAAKAGAAPVPGRP